MFFRNWNKNTNTIRCSPLHVELDDRAGTTGEILCEQVKDVGLNTRQFIHAEHLPSDIIERILTCIISCFDA
jgi:mRNA-degrading endonuclease toxin of MazEF toxin-antitoxin module